MTTFSIDLEHLRNALTTVAAFASTSQKAMTEQRVVRLTPFTDHAELTAYSQSMMATASVPITNLGEDADIVDIPLQQVRDILTVFQLDPEMSTEITIEVFQDEWQLSDTSALFPGPKLRMARGALNSYPPVAEVIQDWRAKPAKATAPSVFRGLRDDAAVALAKVVKVFHLPELQIRASGTSHAFLLTAGPLTAVIRAAFDDEYGTSN